MGSFVYMIARDDADIIEEKRPEFEERLEKVFNAAGMMEQEHLTLFGKGIRALRPVRIENGYTTFFYNYFEDDVWENAGYYNKNGGVYSEKVGWRNFARAIEAAYMLQIAGIAKHIFEHHEQHVHPQGKDIYTALFAVDKIQTLSCVGRTEKRSVTADVCIKFLRTCHKMLSLGVIYYKRGYMTRNGI